MLFQTPSSEYFFLVLTTDYERTCFILPWEPTLTLFLNPNFDFEQKERIPENEYLRQRSSEKKKWQPGYTHSPIQIALPNIVIAEFDTWR